MAAYRENPMAAVSRPDGLVGCYQAGSRRP